MLYACWVQRHSYTPHQYSNQKLVSVSACVLLFHLLPSLFLPLLPSLSSLPSSLLSPFLSPSLHIYIYMNISFLHVRVLHTRRPRDVVIVYMLSYCMAQINWLSLGLEKIYIKNSLGIRIW